MAQLDSYEMFEKGDKMMKKILLKDMKIRISNMEHNCLHPGILRIKGG